MLLITHENARDCIRNSPHLKDEAILRLAVFVQGQFSEQNCLPLLR